MSDKLCESNITHIKQKDFEDYLEIHLKFTKHIMNKWKHCSNNKYTYFDINAHKGRMDDGSEGSPLIFTKKAMLHNLEYNALFIEKDCGYYNQLTKELPLSKSISVINGDNESVMKQYSNELTGSMNYGMLYHDPTGVPSTDLLSSLSKLKSFSKIDFLINCNASEIKRQRNMGNKTGNQFVTDRRTLKERLDAINKNHWIVREPIGGWQWSLIIGTNWVHMPSLNKNGFHSITSEKGREIFNRLNFTKQELNDIGAKSYVQMSLIAEGI